MEGIKFTNKPRNYETQLGIDFTDINPTYIECGDKTLLKDGDRLYVQGSAIPVLIYRKKENIFRIYTNDGNAYIPFDRIPFFVVNYEKLETN